MNNTFNFDRQFAEDVQTAELRLEYNKVRKTVQAPVHYINKKEQFAEAVWEKMYGHRQAVKAA